MQEMFQLDCSLFFLFDQKDEINFSFGVSEVKAFSEKCATFAKNIPFYVFSVSNLRKTHALSLRDTRLLFSHPLKSV